MQIGLVCRNQFAGDEVLLLGENPLPYSVVTQGKVTAYKIKSRDLFNLPHDILDNVKKNCFIKLKHIEDRQAQIIQEVDKVAAWDKQHDQFTEKVNKMSDRFVSASEQAFRGCIQNLRLQELPKDLKVKRSVRSRILEIEQNKDSPAGKKIHRRIARGSSLF